MPQPPVTDEIGAAFGRFFFMGAGPSHSALTGVFAGAGYGSDDPYDLRTQTPNKETRVQTVYRAAARRPQRGRELTEGLLARLRVYGCFDSRREADFQEAVVATRRALARSGWTLDAEGNLAVAGAIDLSTGDRPALDEQLDRLRRSPEDPGQLLGTAKDLLESVAKLVLEEFSVPVSRNMDFGQLWHLARDRLGVLPQQVTVPDPGGRQIKTLLQSSWNIAEQVNELRNLQGAGHGRTLPTGVSPELALLVVREACSVAEFMLTTLDRAVGRNSP